MRVLIATDSFPPGCGGSGWSTFELVRGLRALGHEITIVHAVCRSGVGVSPLRVGSRREYDGFVIHEVAVPAPPVPYVRNYFKNERSYRRLTPIFRDLIRTSGCQVVHAQHVLTAPPAVLAARLEHVPVVCTIRDYWPLCYWADLIHDPAGTSLCPSCSATMMTRCVRPRAGRAWPLALPFVPYMRRNLRRKRVALSRASALVAVGSTLARDLAARTSELAGARVETIPNPVDVDGVLAAADRPHPLEGRPYAIYVGKLARNKGIASLLPAAERAGLTWPLIVVGDGPARAVMERAAGASRLDVRLLGWLDRPEALAWLAHARLVLFPSYGPESLSRVLLEAGALGRPIAAMDTGGTRDIIVDGQTGLLAETSEQLGDAAARLVRDSGLAVRLGAGAAAFVRDRFDTPRVVARIDRLYRELVAGEGGAGVPRG